MRIGRLILVVVAVAAFIVFAEANWTAVPMVFGPTEVLIRLPVLLLLTVLAGFLPGYLMYRIARGRKRVAAPVMVAPPVRSMPSEAQPIAVPPGCG